MMGEKARRPQPIFGTASRFSAALAVAFVIMASIATVPITAGPGAATSGRPSVVVDGRGWGHGRGMSQYGALGYARDFGWSSAQILDHYYGGTSAGPAPQPGVLDAANLRVDLVYLRGRSTTVGLDDGTIDLLTSDGTVLQTVTGAVRLEVDGSAMRLSTAATCSGPWTDQPALPHSIVRIRANTSNTGQAGLLHACGQSYWTWYDGEIRAVSSTSGQRTINIVSVEQYLRGVVPNEVPASWPEAALQAQAVAARSYVLAGDTRWSSYADTCDSTLCQVYDGRFTTRAGLRTSTHDRTDAAIAATAGIVRLYGNGTVARTEFSSSSGGHTVAGDFPAVADAGDAVSANPNATWEVTVDLKSFEESIQDSDDLGSLLGAAVVERNGLGADGGRAEHVNFYFEDGTVTLDGNAVRRKFGLKSDWFSFGPLMRDDQAVVDTDLEAEVRFVDQAFRRLSGRAPSAQETDQWVRTLRTGSRKNLAEQLVHGEYFSGVVVDDLYQTAFGRSADGDGRRYWIQEMANGLKYEHVGTLFYGSPEYVSRSGNTNPGFVEALYVNILDRPSDTGGKAYWVGQLDQGTATPADVANAFYVSLESRLDRARSVHLRVLDSSPGAANATYADRLLVVDDLTLASELAVELGALS